jgi:hypothetical protein
VVDLPAIDITPISEARPAPEWIERGGSTALARGNPSSRFDSTVVFHGRVLEKSSGPVSGASTEEASVLSRHVSHSDRDPVEVAADSRVMLLAKKFEAGATKEELARIEILSNRLNRLAPRTTPEDIDRLAAAVGEAEAIALDLKSITEQFDL